MNPKVPSTAVIGGRTARELLVYVAGEDHALHSVIGKKKPFGGEIRFVCSCGQPFEVAATDANLAALRNVVELVKASETGK